MKVKSDPLPNDINPLSEEKNCFSMKKRQKKAFSKKQEQLVRSKSQKNCSELVARLLESGNVSWSVLSV